MRVILSRKGFDSGYGKCPSPIMPDGTLLSLPIPDEGDKIRFSNLTHRGKSYLDIITELKPGAGLTEQSTCHLDPDLRGESLQRGEGWAPLFGQCGAAGGHLENQKVQPGDLFLFFGWFRETELKNNKLRYVAKAPPKHVIFGYLQIGKVHRHPNFPSSVQYHPHTMEYLLSQSRNRIYEAGKELSFAPGLAGAGCFDYSTQLVLTREGHPRSRWQLPPIFRDVHITYHSDKSFRDGYFQSAAKGQEFVIQHNHRIAAWAENLVAQHAENHINQPLCAFQETS